MHESFRDCLAMEMEGLENLILGKNIKYGNSVFEPIRIFAKNATVEDLINNRIDDKLSRIARGQGEDEDPELDLIGYLILKRVWRRLQARSKAVNVRTLNDKS